MHLRYCLCLTCSSLSNLSFSRKVSSVWLEVLYIIAWPGFALRSVSCLHLSCSAMAWPGVLCTLCAGQPRKYLFPMLVISDLSIVMQTSVVGVSLKEMKTIHVE